MLIDLTQEEVDLILNQLESLEKALAKVQRSKRLMRACDRRVSSSHRGPNWFSEG